jgi:DNA-binding response OmpR family regulator
MNTILIVEDEVSLLTILKQTLELYNYKVITSVNGVQGLKLFYQHKPDIIVLDIMLPLKDGYTLIKEIRATDRDTPVIFLTAKSQTFDVVKGFELGCNDYLRKPFVIDELLARIKSLLSRKPVGQKPVQKETYEIGHFKFNYNSQELISIGGTIQLTYKEAEILKMLVLRKNGVVEKKDLLNELWGDDNFYTARTLNVFVTKLRQYLKTDDRVQILNMRSVGFKLVEKEKQ